MNYEELFAQLVSTEKEIKDKISGGQKITKTIDKEIESGDLKQLKKDAAQLLEVAENIKQAIEKLISQTNDFDTAAYFESGEFEQQMLEYCEKYEIDVLADAPIYEMFPYKVKVDMENQDLYIDRKKIQCMRPEGFVKLVKAGQDKLNKATFNAAAFASELSEAYDIAIMKQGKKPGTDIYLQSLYKIMTPMARSRKEYDQQNFAFDLARLYAAYVEGNMETKSGRVYQFGPNRFSNKAVRILDKNGKEQFLTTINFLDE